MATYFLTLEQAMIFNENEAKLGLLKTTCGGNMKARVEASGLSMKDNAITEALYDKKWGIRLTFTDDNETIRQNIVLDCVDAEILISDIKKALLEIKKVTK